MFNIDTCSLCGVIGACVREMCACVHTLNSINTTERREKVLFFSCIVTGGASWLEFLGGLEVGHGVGEMSLDGVFLHIANVLTDLLHQLL